MDISAKTVVTVMDKQLAALASAVNTGTKEQVREHAAALKAYCDLLLADKQEEVTALTQQAAPHAMDLPKQKTVKTTDSLLDF